MLFLVRHGETAPNVAGLFLGRADPPLTALGERQAAALAAGLPRPDVVVSSPLRRARDTAAAFGVDVRVDDRWIELDYGSLDGTAAEHLAAEVRARWRRDPTFAPGGGESLARLSERVRPACEEAYAWSRDAVVVVVSHVSPIKAAIAWALGVADTVAWRMFVEDAGVCRIDTGEDGPILRWFNRGLAPAR